jgi:hypothetical protein
VDGASAVDIPDGLPCLGPASGSGDIVHAFGHGHVGLTAGATTGKIVAEIIAGRPVSVDLTPLCGEALRMTELAGRIALVTGASRGIGRAIAIALAKAGADVAVNYRQRATEAVDVVETIHAMGRRAIAVPADVSRGDAVAGMFRAIEHGLGNVDILVNNAGIAIFHNIDALTEEDFDHTIAVNLKSAFLCIRRPFRICGNAVGAGSSTSPPARRVGREGLGRITMRRRRAWRAWHEATPPGWSNTGSRSIPWRHR